jgi:hypothetical protein
MGGLSIQWNGFFFDLVGYLLHGFTTRKLAG